MVCIVFGSQEANEIRRRDIALGVLSDCKDYGGTAPRPERDSEGNWIEYPADEEEDGENEMYLLSAHAMQRIRQRRIKVEDLLAALEGKRAMLADGTLVLCDPASLCALYINQQNSTVITAVELSPTKFTRIYKTKRRKQWP